MDKKLRKKINEQERMKQEKHEAKVASAMSKFSEGSTTTNSDKGLRCPKCKYLNSLSLTRKTGYYEDFKCTRCGANVRHSLINGALKEFE